MNKEQKLALTAQEILKLAKKYFYSTKFSENGKLMEEAKFEAFEKELLLITQPEKTYLDKEKVCYEICQSHSLVDGFGKPDKTTYEAMLELVDKICQLTVPEKSEEVGMSDKEIGMKNVPKKIYLVVNTEEIDETEGAFNDFDKLDHEFVCWCPDRNNKSDIEYVLSSPSKPAVVVEPNEEIERLKAENNELQTTLDALIKTTNKTTTPESIAEALPSLTDAENEYYNNETPFDGEHEGWMACYEYMRQQAIEKLSGKIVVPPPTITKEKLLDIIRGGEKFGWNNEAVSKQGKLADDILNYLSMPTTTKEERK